MSGVIFDLDGTLIDSAPDIHRCAALMLADEGLDPLTLPQIRSFIGNGAPVLVRRVMAAVALPDDPALHARLLARFLEHYETAVTLTRLYDGVAACLEDLAAAGRPVGLCTNKPIGPTRAVLAHFGLAQHFPTVIGGDSLPQRKPDPAPLLACLREMGCGKAVFVGDSEVDAECAARAGMDFALFTEGYRKAPVDTLPHAFAFSHHGELEGWLREYTFIS
ncbi:phosphoglycolate phosphatase [Plastorhodobacter daqingensis]|uniref:Phosphoglycolate phosphatase n=1 Tax=Plastorhodobacter daqingensis TaxID=1387281 RepID=A0ABW2UFZ8_9RHOB